MQSSNSIKPNVHTSAAGPPPLSIVSGLKYRGRLQLQQKIWVHISIIEYNINLCLKDIEKELLAPVEITY